MTEEVKNTPIVSSDDDMEEPKTKDYAAEAENAQKGSSDTVTDRMAIFVKQEFKDALMGTIGNLGYDRVLGTAEQNVKVSQIFEIVDNVIGKPLSEDQANQLVNMISKAPYNIIHAVMDNIKKDQRMYFDVKKVVVQN